MCMSHKDSFEAAAQSETCTGTDADSCLPLQGSKAAKEQVSALSQAGHCWAEVWCGPPHTGTWVHIDVLAHWLNEPGKVHADLRPQPSSSSRLPMISVCDPRQKGLHINASSSPISA